MYVYVCLYANVCFNGSSVCVYTCVYICTPLSARVWGTWMCFYVCIHVGLCVHVCAQLTVMFWVGVANRGVVHSHNAPRRRYQNSQVTEPSLPSPRPGPAS